MCKVPLHPDTILTKKKLRRKEKDLETSNGDLSSSHLLISQIINSSLLLKENFLSNYLPRLVVTGYGGYSNCLAWHLALLKGFWVRFFELRISAWMSNALSCLWITGAASHFANSYHLLAEQWSAVQLDGPLQFKSRLHHTGYVTLNKLLNLSSP